MKFTLIKDLRQDPLMRPILSGLLLFTLLYLIVDIVVKYYNLGIFPDAISNTLFGNEEEYLDPITTSALLEGWHIEIFFIMMILLTLSAVYIRLCNQQMRSIIVLNITILSALLSLVALPFSYFLSDSFVLVYVLSFFSWHIFAFYMALYSLWKLHYDPSL